MKFRVSLAGEEAEIEVRRQGNRFYVTCGQTTTEVELAYQDGAVFVLAVSNASDGSFVQQRQIHAAGHARGEQRQLWVDGKLLTYQRPAGKVSQSPASSGEVHDLNVLSASIPAVVSEVLVNVGDRVAAGDRLILLESMKMILPIQAPYAGVVSDIRCQVGESVQPGVPLVDLDEIAG